VFGDTVQLPFRVATGPFWKVSGRLTATKVPGIVTGFFLHRDFARQEIDVES